MSDPADFPTFSRPAGAPWQHGDLHTREWLLTDGRGGYACGTALDLPTRRYHGWLCAPIGSTARRTMLVAGADERCVVDGIETILSTAWWQGQAGPDLPGVALQFAHRPWPCWTFSHGRFTVRRELLLLRGGGQPAVAVRWTNRGERPLRLRVAPWLCGRDADALRRAGAEPPVSGFVQGASWRLQADQDGPPVWLSVEGVAAFVPAGNWYRNLFLVEEQSRGYDHVEDRWSPGTLELDLGPGRTAVAVFGAGEPCRAPAEAWEHAAGVAAATVERVGGETDRLRRRLLLSAKDFHYRDHAGRPGVLAGFPWFGEWGRDTFLALPGLTLSHGDVDGCLQVLRGALPFLRDGLLPNIFGATPEDSHYGAADAALWFALCVARLCDLEGGSRIVKQEFAAALRQIAEASFDGNAMLRAWASTACSMWATRTSTPPGWMRARRRVR
ncbi:MAG: glycogen debranching enzyme family protein [Planctomycetes bacterium]|nr:glycogen debranching enzyme family protein [Planctomycetota bacterium]